MPRPPAIILGLTLLVLPLPVRAVDPPRDGDVPSFARDVPGGRSAEPIFRFNNRDLTGFYAFTRDHKYEDPKQVFTVQDGLLRISGEEFGGLSTCGNFSNYHLVTVWKWGQKTWPPRVDKARDSGILVHCVGPDGAAMGQWMQSQECQIIEGGCGDFIMVPGQAKPSLSCETRTGPDKQPYYEKGGTLISRNSGRYNWWGRDPEWKDVLGFRGHRDVEKPTGEWNRMDVICDGDTITVILNGFVVNVGSKSSQTDGKIQFQSEGAEIFFRTIEIRPLVK
jgi:hypothetical protein